MVDVLEQYKRHDMATSWVEEPFKDAVEGMNLIVRSFVPLEEKTSERAWIALDVMAPRIVPIMKEVQTASSRWNRPLHGVYTPRKHPDLASPWLARHYLAPIRKGQIRESSLSETVTQVKNLIEWDEGWNGYNAAAPDPNAIRHAISWIREMHNDVLVMGEGWRTPHVTADAHGTVVFEWWQDRNKLTIYVSPETIEYVKVWGPDIFSQMTDGEIEGSEDHQALWRWLIGRA